MLIINNEQQSFFSNTMACTCM